jgi:hypothetical protein
MSKWIKSSYSAHLGACVQVKRTPDGVAVRHSRRRKAERIHYTMAEWEAFLAGVLNGEFKFTGAEK